MESCCGSGEVLDSQFREREGYMETNTCPMVRLHPTDKYPMADMKTIPFPGGICIPLSSRQNECISGREEQVCEAAFICLHAQTYNNTGNDSVATEHHHDVVDACLGRFDRNTASGKTEYSYEETCVTLNSLKDQAGHEKLCIAEGDNPLLQLDHTVQLHKTKCDEVSTERAALTKYSLDQVLKMVDNCKTTAVAKLYRENVTPVRHTGMRWDLDGQPAFTVDVSAKSKLKGGLSMCMKMKSKVRFWRPSNASTIQLSGDIVDVEIKSQDDRDMVKKVIKEWYSCEPRRYDLRKRNCRHFCGECINIAGKYLDLNEKGKMQARAMLSTTIKEDIRCSCVHVMSSWIWGWLFPCFVGNRSGNSFPVPFAL